jgi:hypothetical protein
MGIFHGHPATTVTNKFHRRQFIFAHVSGFNIRGTAEVAFFCIAAGIT